MKIDSAKFLSIGFNQPPELPWHIGAHSHSVHEVIVPTAGAQTVLIRNRRIRAETGSILFYPAGASHEEWAEAGQKFSTLFFSFSWPDCPGDLPLILTDRAGRARLLLDWLYAERRTASKITDTVCQSLFMAVLGQILRSWLHHDDELVGRIRMHVLDNITEQLSLDHLAAVARTSKFHFIRRYRQLTGRTPMEDVRALRIERARELIMTTDLPIKVIAEQVGIVSVYHLCRIFKQQLGVTPGSLRSRTKA